MKLRLMSTLLLLSTLGLTAGQTVNYVQAAENEPAVVSEANGNKAVKYSDASVTVDDGVLSLDAVPDFKFSRTPAGKKAGLESNASSISDDSTQGSGLLRITDSRVHQDSQAGSPEIYGLGYNLSLSLSDFKKNEVAVTGFQMGFPQVNAANRDNNGKISTIKQTIAAGSNDHTLVQAPAGSGYGETDFNLDNGNAAVARDMFLTVPVRATAGDYQAVLTWTLTPAAK
ncbi:WxL domain-containing protein [Lactobacillus sp. DCY120]|uniref:WxL domain-containing protein n=1 Tax=Bombilactobacillus apium TaxID=2675299 RepID=A0A850QZX8_9LACO|nr:WxL domain-containing protein [Bombilactobacillus apium]NVY96243.1 WxL domain-containing protein [Bombilactobacillus apium]